MDSRFVAGFADMAAAAATAAVIRHVTVEVVRAAFINDSFSAGKRLDRREVKEGWDGVVGDVIQGTHR